jgi:uncharacterized protein (TIGR03437 family)
MAVVIRENFFANPNRFHASASMELLRFISRLLVSAFLLVMCAAGQTITTVAGNSTWGLVYNVALDAAGSMYVADSTRHMVYKIDTLGAATVIAGTGTAGNSGDGALATAAQLRNPMGAAVGPDGSIYIADYGNDRIRRIAPNGIITTFAGTTGGFSGDGGPATAARMNGPRSIAVDGSGNVFFTDGLNYRIRRISTAGVITTVAGTGGTSRSGDGGPATAADSLPVWFALAPDGSIYFTDDFDERFNGHKRVRRVAPNGVITTVAGTGVAGFSGDGGPATQAQFRSVSGVAVDSGGNIYVSDAIGARIRRIDPSGIIRTYAGTGTGGAGGDGGAAISAQLNFPTGLAVDSAGNLYVADRNNMKIRRILPPPAPRIRDTNPVLSSFMGSAGFSSNTYLEIYGTSFTTVSRTWSGSDFSGSSAPTSLDGVRVTVNGRPAFVYYISPTQININTPDDTTVGPVSIQVHSPLGTSPAVSANRTRLSPTLQTVPQFNAGGRQYVVALTPDFTTYIGRPGMVQGVPFAAAIPGDVVSIYALGAGPTTPPTQAGVIAAQASSLALPYELRIGGVPAQVTFAGMVAGSIGLYQFNVVIPSVGPGDQPIELTVDGVTNNQNLFIVIGQ